LSPIIISGRPIASILPPALLAPRLSVPGTGGDARRTESTPATGAGEHPEWSWAF
jgi:hypothetical protein